MLDDLFKTLSHDGHYRAQVDLNRVTKSNAIKAVDVVTIRCKLIQMCFILRCSDDKQKHTSFEKNSP